MILYNLLQTIKTYWKNPRKYLNVSEYDCTTLGFLVTVGCFCAFVEGVIGFVGVASESNGIPFWLAVTLLVLAVLTVSFGICWAGATTTVVSDDKDGERSTTSIMALIAFFGAYVLSGLFFVTIAISVVVDIMAFFVYYIPMSIIRILAKPMAKEDKKKLKSLYSSFLSFKAYKI